MSDTNTTVNINTSDYAHVAYTRNCNTFQTTGRNLFAIRARDIGRRLGFSSSKVSNDLGITTTTLTNYVRTRNQTDRRFDGIISSLSQAADYRKRTGKVHPAHRSLILAVSSQYSTRVAAALGGISPSTASVWARAEKERIAREWSISFLNDIASSESSASSSGNQISNRRRSRVNPTR
jgi:hypothetical protein